MTPQPVDRWHGFSTYAEDPSAYLSMYLSDELARLPVRAVTLPGNNKSDPNLETLSFGVFSTCEPSLRSGAVRRGIRYLFFATNHRSRGRALTGYYRLRWWAEGSFGAARRDYALAADLARFTDPVPFTAIPGEVGVFVRMPFRQVRLLSAENADQLLNLLNGLPDRTADYVSEIRRLERYNAYHGGVRYAGWAEGGGFTWASAGQYLTSAQPEMATVRNTSPSDWWRCSVCGRENRNKALLKRCPTCGAVGTLKPATEPTLA